VADKELLSASGDAGRSAPSGVGEREIPHLSRRSA